MEIERIVERIYKLSKKNHRTTLLSETIMEVLGNSEKIFNTNEKNTTIFKEIIKTQNCRGVYCRLAERYSVKKQRIFIIQDCMIEKMYLADAKRRFQKLETNEEKLNADINMTGLDNKTLDILTELHCKKVKDIFEIEEKYLKEVFRIRQVEYKRLVIRLNELGISAPEKKDHHVKLLEELDMTPRAYKYIKGNGICTNMDFIRNINSLLNDPKISDVTKKQIKDLYIRVRNELDVIEPEEQNKNFNK